MDSPLLPTPFSTSHLWAVCLQDQRSGSLQEGFVLADPGREGLEVLQQTYPETSHHRLLMAFSLDQLERLEATLRDSEASEGALHSQATVPERDWPQWRRTTPGSYLVFQGDAQKHSAHWVRALSRSQALMAAQAAKPELVTLAVGEMDAFSEHLGAMRTVVQNQDFGSVMTDLRRQVLRPASRVQIAAYPLAAAGLFATPQEAMEKHQALFLATINEENWHD